MLKSNEKKKLWYVTKATPTYGLYFVTDFVKEIYYLGYCKSLAYFFGKSYIAKYYLKSNHTFAVHMNS